MPGRATPCIAVLLDIAPRQWIVTNGLDIYASVGCRLAFKCGRTNGMCVDGSDDVFCEHELPEGTAVYAAGTVVKRASVFLRSNRACGSGVADGFARGSRCSAYRRPRPKGGCTQARRRWQ